MESDSAKSDRLNVHSFRWIFVQNLVGFSFRMSSARLPLPFVNPIESFFRSNIVVIVVVVVIVIARRSNVRDTHTQRYRTSVNPANDKPRRFQK